MEAGKTYSSDSEDETPTLPDESEPKEKSRIPEDDPEYFMKMRDPTLLGSPVLDRLSLGHPQDLFF